MHIKKNKCIFYFIYKNQYIEIKLKYKKILRFLLNIFTK